MIDISYEKIVYILILCIAAFSSTSLGIYTYFKARGKQGVKPYLWLTSASTIYSLTYAFALHSIHSKEIIFWLKMEYTVIPVIPAFFIIMALEYVGYGGYFRPKLLFSIFTIPIITYCMYYTNNFHHLYYQSILITTARPVIRVLLFKGPWYWVQITYAYACILGGLIILLNHIKKTNYIYTMQTINMCIGMLLPLIGNAVYLTGLSPSGIDLTPLMMSLACPFHARSLISFRMFHIIPIAHEKVFESMRDGVLIVDEENKILDFNQAATTIFLSLTSNFIGKDIFKLLSEENIVFPCNEEYDIKVTHKDKELFLRAHKSPIIKSDGQTIGNTILLVDISDVILINKKLRKQATIDGMTQIFNRSYFLDKSYNKLKKGQISKSPISFILIDIDYFKKINDTFGHEFGDTAIKHIVNICKDNLRQGDILGRYGGEEFAVCLPNTTLEEAVDVAERLRIKIAKYPISSPQGDIYVTASFGIAGRDICSIDMEVDIFLREADIGLYKAKENGRNCVFSFNKEHILIRKN